MSKHELSDQDLEILKNLQITMNNIRAIMAMQLNNIAKRDFGYEVTDHLQFEVEWDEKCVKVTEVKQDGSQEG